MKKIPVGKTIAYAYSFTFGHLGAIIGFAWLALVLIAVLQFLPYAMGGNPMAEPENATIAGRQALEGMGTSLLAALLYSIIYVPVTRLALGLRQEAAIVHFALGAPELRVFGAIVLFALVVIGMAFGIGILSAILGVAMAMIGKAGAAILALAILAALLAFIYIIVRLGFLVVPVTVAEGQISLSRGWILTQGNFWRIFALLLAIFLPLMVVHAVGIAAIIGAPLFAPLPEGAEAAGRAIGERFALLGQHMPVYLGLSLILAPFSIGLSLGASAFAYRAQVPPPKPQGES
ncbi:MAG TPA: hypothetical protein VIM02_01035 [Rhizomicrobium sp.]|jgi:hypothetical protein